MGADSASPTGESCVLHPFEVAERLCHQCGRWHCDGCLVAPWGPRKPALCVECAINRGGVRRSAGAAPVRTPRQIRDVEKGKRTQESEDPGQRVTMGPGGMPPQQPAPTAGRLGRFGRRRSG